MPTFFSLSATSVNNFLPYLLLGSAETSSVPVGLGESFSSTPVRNPGNGVLRSVNRQLEYALARLAFAVSILSVFLLLSRLVIRGLLTGTDKN